MCTGIRCLLLAGKRNDGRPLVEGQQHPRRYLGALAAKAKPDDLVRRCRLTL